jgi:hypothetical protein
MVELAQSGGVEQADEQFQQHNIVFFKLSSLLLLLKRVRYTQEKEGASPSDEHRNSKRASSQFHKNTIFLNCEANIKLYPRIYALIVVLFNTTNREP